MFDKSAIQELTKAQAITAAAEAVEGQAESLVALPSDFTVHDVEKFLSRRRRARGVMETTSIEDFGTYVGAHKQVEGAACFIDPQKMQAVAVLNLGSPTAPGHADDLAKLSLRATAAYSALRKITDAGPTNQRTIAEFLEDWPAELQFYREGAHLTPPQAIAAVRDITIEHLKKHGSNEQQLSAERSTFEKVAAAGELPLPTHLYFFCVPYLGLSARTFVMRLALHTSNGIGISLRIATLEKHAEEMAQELADLTRKALADKVPVLVGSYKPGT